MEPNDLQTVADGLIDALQQELNQFRDDSGQLQERPIDEYPYNKQIVRLLKKASEGKWLKDQLETASTRDEETIDDLNELISETDTLRTEFTDSLNETLREQFDQYYEAYPRNVCRVFEFEPINNETPNTIDRRDTLQFLFDELAITDAEIVEGISVLDDVLRCKYEQNTDLIRDLHLARPYFPDHYWWRHPEQVVD